MVKITLEFMNVEAAIIALGKLSAIGKARRAAQSTGALETLGAEQSAAALATTGETPSAAPAAPTTRKGRADKGKPRGPYKNAPAADNTPQTAAPEAKAEAPAAGVPEAVPDLAVAPQSQPATEGVDRAAPADGRGPEGAQPVPGTAPSAEDAQKALERVFEAQKNGGIEAARQLMSRFGVRRLRELPDDKRAEFIALADDVLAGKATL